MFAVIHVDRCMAIAAQRVAVAGWLRFVCRTFVRISDVAIQFGTCDQPPLHLSHDSCCHALAGFRILAVL